MSQHYYADGAKHIDHHKEININLTGTLAGSEDAIAKLSKDFFADDDVEDASFEEVEDENSSNVDSTINEDKEIPQSVKDVFVQPTFIESYVRTMMTNYYDGKPLSLALIYCVLKDYSLIRSVGDYQKFVRALIDWQMLSTMDEKQVKTLADGVSAYMRDRNDHGKIRPGLTSGFRNWTDAKKRQQCEAIASVFGEEDDYLYPEGTIHYQYKK